MGTLAGLVDEAVFNVQGFGGKVLRKLGGLGLVLIEHAEHVEGGDIHELGTGTEDDTYFKGAWR